MWLSISVPDFGAGARVTVARLHAQVGDRLTPGSALLDLEVDLSGGVVRDCPPLSTCRIVLREAAWLRGIRSDPAALLVTGDRLAELSIEPASEPAPPGREARVTAAAVLHHADWWSDQA